jgi:hypothetical protein
MKRVTRQHGLSYTPEYRVWQTMRLRCHEPNNPAYNNYGGRGIKVCDRWLDSPENFIADMGSKPTPAHEIDRIDNDGGYEPTNCRWVLRAENSRNRRSNRLVELNGESKPLAEWCEKFGVPRDTARKRLEAGWSPEEALTIPPRSKAANGEGKPKKNQSCVDCGVTVYSKRCKSCENARRWKEGVYP